MSDLLTLAGLIIAVLAAALFRANGKLKARDLQDAKRDKATLERIRDAEYSEGDPADDSTYISEWLRRNRGK